jgi:hypothetical protein
MKLSHVVAAFSLALVAVPLAGGCGSGMDPKECSKLREDAFELLNKPQHCNGDADCKQSDWPGCAKPLSAVSYDKIKPMKDSFTKGKCEEPKPDCREAPPSYCKQGLCVHKEKGTPEGAGNTPIDQIQVK